MRDLIIDCFAGGGGASVGIEMALGRSVDIAINHDPDAILMHKTNHPGTLHLTEDIFKVARIGNSVVPVMAEALVKANCLYLKVGERKAAPMIYMQNNGQVAFG